MGIKESMMNLMMGNMSSDEKKEMMNKMMDNFFSGMSDEDKQAMMSEMMPKMMEQMMGGGGMMDMMGMMMGHKGGDEGEGFNPMDMCRQMMSSMNEGRNVAAFATPEIRDLFKDWVQQINEEILGFMQEQQSASIEQIAEHLKLSDNSIIYLLGTLAQEGKLKLAAEAITQ
ncbi:FeoC-like transcriptional regulator [Thermodesulfobacteriota bacterium]